MIDEKDIASLDIGITIKVAGVGGGGSNAVERMIQDKLQQIEFISINTDTQSLQKSKAPVKVKIGEKITRGQGAGSNPDLGKRAADESVDEITAAIKGAHMLFITAGMGGGTGTGATPTIARVAKELGILTIAIVTKPFNFEGKQRAKQAEIGIAELAKYVDSLIVIPNERLKLLTDKKITLVNAFQEADDILRKGVRSISELITDYGYINLDFADISTVMTNAGYAHMGVGSAKGKDKAEQAAKLAMSSPLLETNISGAKGIIVNITSSPDIGLDEIDQAASMITAEADNDANVIFGAVFDPSLEDEMRITLIATGFDRKSIKEQPQSYSQQKIGENKPEHDKSTVSTDDDINNIINMLNKNRNF
ncbi:MAG: cell division protein FtsZ [Clostridia bacterium]